MATDTPIELRLSAIEERVAELESKVGARKHAKDWLSRMMGAFRKYPEFGEIVEEGKRLANVEDGETDEPIRR